MTSAFSLLLIAVAAGIAVALQGQAMGALNRTAGTAATMLATYGSGAIISAIIWLFRRSAGGSVTIGNLAYGFAAGALGLVIVGGIGFAAPRLGLSRTLVITVAAQLGAAMLIESTGLFGATARPLDFSKAAGVLVTAIGVWLVVK
ncbi:MAG TPA: DMT family transporter [Thermoanaerobaculia bacterium]|jgi:transporter family-2 protein